MDDTDPPKTSLFALHRIPNGLVVLLTVALLLQGPVGAFEALRDYSLELLRVFFGGEDLFWEVLCQTAPLALATAAITFAYRCRWLSLSGPTSLVAASLIVLGGTWVGGELRTFLAKKRPVTASQITAKPASLRSATRVSLSDQQHSEGIPDTSGAEQAKTISVAEAIKKLSDLRSPATDASHHQWTGSVPRVALIPEPESVVGFVAQAINQILGYLVVYRPRLFLAAVLLGTYIGWSWQPYFQCLRSWAGKDVVLQCHGEVKRPYRS